MVSLLPSGSFKRRLDEALQRVEEGQEPVSAAGLNWSMADLQELLQTAAVMQEVPREITDQPAKTRVRNRFMAEAAGRRVAWVHRHAVPLKAKRKAQRIGPRFGSMTALVLLGLVALIAGSLAAVAAGFSEPDSPLYPLKELGEGGLAAITVDSVANADLKVTYAGQRLREAEAMAGRGHPDLTVDSVRGHYQDLREAAQALLSVHDRGSRWIHVRDRLTDEEGKPLTSVESQLENSGNTDASTEVRQLVANFDAERKVLDKELISPLENPKAPASQRPTPTR